VALIGGKQRTRCSSLRQHHQLKVMVVVVVVVVEELAHLEAVDFLHQEDVETQHGLPSDADSATPNTDNASTDRMSTSMIEI
jgi:hypothetical protein